MARGLTTSVLRPAGVVVLLLAGVPGFGQIIPGIGYPGGGYPGGGGGYPGRQRYPQGGQGRTPTSNNQAQTSTLTGMLRKVEEKRVFIESDDRTITTVSIGGSTKYIGASGGSAKIGDFQPGDHVSISANEDNKNTYHATKMAMVKEGTPEEHSAASVAADDTSRPLGINSDGSKESVSKESANGSSADRNEDNRNEGDRPKLRRASDADENATSSSAGSNDERPRLRRAPSGSEDDVQSAQRASAPSPVYNNDDHPRTRRAVSSADDDTPRAEIAPLDSAAPATSAAPQYTDSNDRPQLRRAGQPAQPAQKMPVSGDPFIDKARDAAFSFSETLPNYVVKQFTTRYQTAAARGGRTSWQLLDNVTADVIEENGNERYKNILVNGKPPVRDPEKTGSWSRGEFSSLLQDVMSPITNADFHGKRETTIVNRAAFRYDFSVQQPNSHWRVESEGDSYQPAYTGAIWIDKENYRVLRIEMSAQNLPRAFPLDTVESSVDYDYVPIGEGKYLLPVHSEALSCGRGTSGCTRNVIEFRNYKKFTADTSITFDADK